MRWSQLHIPTLREDPADADAASHRLLLRAGFIRQLMAGHYSLLPLGVRVRTKIINVIREEMNRIGAQEFLLPCMQPAWIWEKSGRLAVMGEEMFRLTDRKGAEVVLGMTHEEIFTSLAVELSSYRQLPQFWYQFQTKFRDEPRPRSGLLRVREFTMKDSYSFDVDEAGPGRLVPGAPGRVRADLRPARHPRDRGRGLQREHGRQRLDRVHVPGRGRRGPRRALQRRRTTRPTWRRRPRRCRRSRTSRDRPRPSGCPPRACARSRTWPRGTASRPTGRSRRWCTSSTASPRWCCCAATTRWPSRSWPTPPARAASGRPRRTRSARRSARRRAAWARSACATCPSSPTSRCAAGGT